MPDKTTYSVGDLTLWQTKLRGVRFAVLPASNSRPNPTVTDSRVFVSIFAPGSVCALERRTGRVVWRRGIGKFASDAVHLHAGALFARSANTLFRLCPDTGEEVWSFCRFGADGETIYSSPCVHGRRLFIGDRQGFLNCLDVNTGEVIWKRLTNESEANVNSTPIVLKGNVIVATNAKTAVAYTLAGKLTWTTHLDGPCIHGLFEDNGSVGVAADSLFFLDPATGRVRRKLTWKGDRIRSVEKSPTRVVLSLDGCWPPMGGSHVMLIGRSDVQRRYHLGSCLAFRYAKETRLIYESHLQGINIRHRHTGQLLAEIHMEGSEGGSLVDARDGVIYALMQRGTVCALRHPPTGLA